MEITKIQPSALWKFFYDLTQIPRPSKHEEKVIEYIVAFAKERKLSLKKDKVGNIVIAKSATPGKENKKTVCLQSHVDMVPQKNNDKVHDFTKDVIETYIDGDWVTANGTTLGADNGIGCAAMLAVLDSSDIEHGPLECLFTIDEETGMTGAFALEKDFLKASILLNLDSEDEGELSIGCAGGMDATVTKKVNFKPTDEGNIALEINVKGLKGGHSGMDINLGRANANKVMVRILNQLIHKVDIGIGALQGGSLRNAIPREASCIILLPPGQKNDALALMDKSIEYITSEYKTTEPNMDISYKDIIAPAGIIDPADMNTLIKSIVAAPNGVISMSAVMPGLVETSLNLAQVMVEKGVFTAKFLLRSSIDSAKHALANRLMALFELVHANVQFAGDYPGWQPKIDSDILEIMKPLVKQVTGKDPDVRAVHAGLECGIIGGVYPDMDMISFGPTIMYPHSPDEKVEIKTVERFWELLKVTLEKI